MIDPLRMAASIEDEVAAAKHMPVNAVAHRPAVR